MISRLHVDLPFSLTVPKNEKYEIWEYQVDGYGVRVYPPRVGVVIAETSGNKILMNGVEAIQANILWIDFIKDSFDRDSHSECDPPFSLINTSINDFIERLRYVLKAPDVKPIDFQNVSWRLTYLDDDENELQLEEGLVRKRCCISKPFSWTVLNKEIWKSVHELPPGWRPPVWQTLLLDARASLPEIGPSLVLAATALEVFISEILNVLAKDHQTPNEIWEWIQNRNWVKKPSTEEQFDFLLQYFVGKGLKSEINLWQGFKNLKNSRNTFVHDGRPMIGNDVVNLEKTKELINIAHEIIEFVSRLIPVKHQLPSFDHKVDVSITQTI